MPAMMFGMLQSSSTKLKTVDCDGVDATSVATLPAPAPPKAPAKQAASAPACPQCGSTEPRGLASWCPQCFYHPKLGSALVSDPAPEIGQHEQASPDTYLGMLKAMPVWVHGLWIGIVVIFIISVAATLLLPPEGPYRMTWTITQAALGLVAAGCAHVIVFLATIPHSDRYGPFDIAMKPLEVWKRTIHKLPADAWRLWQAAWGLTAAFCALTLIGGVPYSAVFEEGAFIQGLKAHLAPRAQRKPEIDVPQRQVDSFQKSMEKAPGSADFSAPPPLEKPAPPRRQAECVIIGYVKSSQDGFSSILLGSRINGHLSYVGSIPASEIPEAVRAKLQKQLPRLEQSKPSVAVRQAATWLKPNVACRIGYKDVTKTKTFDHAEFDELLDQ
jgi:hypothetical protein